MLKYDSYYNPIKIIKQKNALKDYGKKISDIVLSGIYD